MIDKIKQQIEQSLTSFLTKIKKDYKLHLVNPILYDSIREFSLRKGKRLRPLLLILTYKGYCSARKKITPEFYQASTCIELLHIFMLIHDDIIDQSDLRRGKPTLHKLLRGVVKTKNPEKLGYDLAIVIGDIIYALAIDAFLAINEAPKRKEKGLKYFIQTAAFTAMGEFIDTIHGVEALNNVKEKDIFLNYTLKTAKYTFDCPMVTGAILAGAPQKDIEKISKLAILVGQAFQIQDDIIGIFDSEKNIGKPILSDLAESKKTLLVHHAYNRLKGKKHKAFTTIFNKPKPTLNDLKTVRKIFIEAGSLQYSIKAATKRVDQADKILQTLKMRAKYKKIIQETIDEIFEYTERINRQYNTNP